MGPVGSVRSGGRAMSGESKGGPVKFNVHTGEPHLSHLLTVWDAVEVHKVSGGFSVRCQSEIGVVFEASGSDFVDLARGAWANRPQRDFHMHAVVVTTREDVEAATIVCFDSERARKQEARGNRVAAYAVADRATGERIGGVERRSYQPTPVNYRGTRIRKMEGRRIAWFIGDDRVPYPTRWEAIRALIMRNEWRSGSS